MPYDTADPRTLVDAIITRLTEDTSLEIGDAIKPVGVDVDVDGLPIQPYAIVYQTPDGEGEGSLADPDEAGWIRFVVHVFGGTRAQVGWGQYETRQALTGWAPTITDATCSRVELSQGAGIDRDDTLRPPLFWADDEYSFFLAHN